MGWGPVNRCIKAKWSEQTKPVEDVRVVWRTASQHWYVRHGLALLIFLIFLLVLQCDKKEKKYFSKEHAKAGHMLGRCFSHAYTKAHSDTYVIRANTRRHITGVFRIHTRKHIQIRM